MPRAASTRATRTALRLRWSASQLQEAACIFLLPLTPSGCGCQLLQAPLICLACLFVLRSIAWSASIESNGAAGGRCVY